MRSLQQFLLDKNFTKIKLHFTKTNHFEIIGKINGVKGLFILDTGASSSCIGFNVVEKFKLATEDSKIKATGAGSSDMKTMLSQKNTITLGKWNYSKLALVIFDLTHVNTALIEHNAKPVDGIIGADILKKGEAVIDYQKKYLYLKLS
ncbi:MAG: retroviral-like aspartic protease family protein [Bacteroidia bacterium]|nr:retroviral-like aspartic protease family protein [Bacteroidia bacterium]